MNTMKSYLPHAFTLCVCGFLLAVPTLATAQWPAYTWLFTVSTSDSTSGTLGVFGTQAGASNGYDTMDRLVDPANRAFIGVLWVEGANRWAGPSGAYAHDIRAPAAHMSWGLKVWLDPSDASDSGILLTWHPGVVGVPDGYLTTLRVQRTPTGVSLPVTSWDLSAQPVGQVVLPAVRTSDPHYGYWLLLDVIVPEPSGLLALAGGISGMLALRRRG